MNELCALSAGISELLARTSQCPGSEPRQRVKFIISAMMSCAALAWRSTEPESAVSQMPAGSSAVIATAFS
eukprot:15463456-Alexandrium_andersonii.AAC.1